MIRNMQLQKQSYLERKIVIAKEVNSLKQLNYVLKEIYGK
jgi:hypothetical protein